MRGSLRKSGRKHWIILGVAVLGLTSTATVLTFYLPLVLNRITGSQLAIGFAVGSEGIAALTIPLIVGHASDRTWTRFGRRLPYMLAATPLVIAGLLAVALLHSYWLLVAAVFVFFVGYYTYYTAYQSLYPDTLPANHYGRAWAYQSVFQGLGVAVALVGGGALLGIGLGAPFIVSTVLFGAITAVTFFLIKERKGRQNMEHTSIYKVLPHFLGRLKQDRNLRYFLPAHFCWEFSLAAIRAFVLLYLFKGLELTHGEVVPILGVVIVVYLIASIVSGYIADRFDPRQYTFWVICLYAAGMIVTGLTTNQLVLAISFPFGMFAGAAVLMLAYPILLRVTPEDRRGEYTGYYQFNRGLALLLGSSLTGFMIDKLGRFFPDTDGYQVLWLTTGVLVALSLPFFIFLTNQRNSNRQFRGARHVDATPNA